MHADNFKLTLKELGVDGSFVLPVFHAYAHVLSCQALRNPTNLVEFGRTDGEATERLWSDLSPFVRSTRSMLQSNRKLVLGQAIRFRNENKRMGLGDSLVAKDKAAMKVVKTMMKKENAADCFLELNTDTYITYLKLKMDVLLTMAGHFRMDRDPTSLSALSVISSHTLGEIAVRVGDDVVARRSERVAWDVPLTDFGNEVGIPIAGQKFFVKELAALEREGRLRKLIKETLPTLPVRAASDLNKDSFNASLSDWEEFVGRKKLLFEEALRSNVQGYQEIQKKIV
ncbi:unnamed protein product [Mucor hiemalis]